MYIAFFINVSSLINNLEFTLPGGTILYGLLMARV